MVWASKEQCRHGVNCSKRDSCKYEHPQCKYGVNCKKRDSCKYEHPSPLKKKPKITSAPIWVQDSKLKEWVNNLQHNFVYLMNLNMTKIKSLPSGNSWYFLDDKLMWTITLMDQNPNTYKDYHLLAPVGEKYDYSFINITYLFKQYSFYVLAQQNLKNGTIRLLIRRRDD